MRKKVMGKGDLKQACVYINEVCGIPNSGQRPVVVHHLVRGSYPGNVGFVAIKYDQTADARFDQLKAAITRSFARPVHGGTSGPYTTYTWRIQQGREIQLQRLNNNLFIRLLDYNNMEI